VVTRSYDVADIKAVLEAAQVLGRAHRAFRHARAEGERRIEELQNAWVRDHEHLLVDEEDPEYLDEELIEVAKAYLLTGDADGTLPNDVREVLDETRTALAEDLKSAVRLTEPTKQALEAPTAELGAAVRRWFSTARDQGDLRGWPRVLEAWRKALSMTTREAASALGVSPSAIVRYEAGKRSPSVPQIGAMVDCIFAWNPTVEDTRIRATARALARMSGDDPDLSTDILEFAFREQASLQGEVEDALDGLTVVQLRVLAALVATPATLDRLADLVKNDPLRPIKDALDRVHDGTSTEARQ